jgi:hypothetical protein
MDAADARQPLFQRGRFLMAAHPLDAKRRLGVLLTNGA